MQARFRSSSGFSLAEVLVSMGLLTTVSLGVAQLFALSTHANYNARGQTSTTAMAEQKMEQLRALTWGFDVDGQGLPVSDTTTNLSVEPPTAGGSGLNPSPASSLRPHRLDGNGVHLGTGTVPPEGSVFIRRWSIQPLPTNPNNTIVLQVFVTSIVNEGNRNPGPRRRLPGDGVLVSVKTRKAQ